ncbi:hypothetical protein LPTSP4_17240 [Leptospira ryugenii]|uniref:Uncharacterized protein n=1 Tax=Leptospira ryugenii TaxID=1917863 RepID=A0A2P2E004_9LEPT|nr:hypothetical protein [Leptospira ryugenii]GBF50200.1 hypothetical protein LPTSP4_17240 [Leptospira ryugenii]
MNIFINDQKLETTLNGETNIAQVLDEIQTWIEANGKYLRYFTVNGREHNRKELESMGVENAERLDFIVGEELDILEDGLIELDIYVDKVGSTLVGRDSLTEKESRDLQEGVPWIESMLLSTKNLLHLNFASIRPMGKGKNVEEILESLKEKVQNLESAHQIELFLEDLRDLKLFLMDLSSRLAVFRLEEEELIGIIQKFIEDKDKITKDFMLVNESFQSGKDFLATEIMTDAMGRLNALISALLSLQVKHTEIEWSLIKAGDKTLSEVSNALNDGLNSVAAAMEKNDIVYAGDVLEYELPDLLQNLVPLLSQILTRLSGNQKA